jgi:glycosyltransferase involved in cell wall biosynthesis
LTTTARDYVSWRNDYPPGEEKLKGVAIRRFTVEQERDLEEFNRYSDWLYHNPHSKEDELRWLQMQGPVVPELIEYLRAEHHRYDLLVFFTYLYYPTVYGLPIAPEKSVLIPTAHDEPPIKLEIYKDVFELPGALIFNTEAEELLVLDRFDAFKKMRETIGIGMQLLGTPDAAQFRRKHKLPSRFLLYAGRIDEGKGCAELLRFFRYYKEEPGASGQLQMVFVGKLSMKLPEAKDIRYLGFLDEDEKLAAMAAATAVVIPSRLESLSIVALEAFSVGTPILATAGSKVLIDHCRKSNAGLYYSDYNEFEAILDLWLDDKALVREMGKQGQRYIKENFGWEKLISQYELALRSSARPPKPSETPSDEARAEAAASEEALSSEAPLRGAPVEKEQSEEAPSTPSDEASTEDLASEEALPKEALVRETPSEKELSEETPPEKAPSEEPSRESTQAEEAKPEPQKAQSEDKPSSEAPTEDLASEEDLKH